MTPEAKVRDPTIRFAKAQGVEHQRMSFRFGVKRAFPDDCFLIPGGRALFIEFKRPGAEPTPLQYHRLEQLNDLGYWATWADNFDAARSAIVEALATSAVHGTGSGSPLLKSIRRPATRTGRPQNFHHP